MFDYEKQPFYYSGKYGIRPLDNEGLSKYLYSKEGELIIRIPDDE